MFGVGGQIIRPLMLATILMTAFYGTLRRFLTTVRAQLPVTMRFLRFTTHCVRQYQMVRDAGECFGLHSVTRSGYGFRGAIADSGRGMRGVGSKPEQTTLNACAIVIAMTFVGIVTSQVYFRQLFLIRRIELGIQAEFALVPVPPAVLLVGLLATGFVKRFTDEPGRRRWTWLAIVVCGMVIGQHLIAMWLVFPVSAVDLVRHVSEPEKPGGAISMRGDPSPH